MHDAECTAKSMCVCPEEHFALHPVQDIAGSHKADMFLFLLVCLFVCALAALYRLSLRGTGVLWTLELRPGKAVVGPCCVHNTELESALP